MTYKGYTGALDIDEDSGELSGRVLGTRDIITFVGMTVEEARRSFEETIDAYLRSCAEQGDEPDRPFSGKFLVRISPATHQTLAEIAHLRRASLNDVAVEALEGYAAANRRGPGPDPETTPATNKPSRGRRNRISGA